MEPPATEPTAEALALARAPWPQFQVAEDAFAAHLVALPAPPPPAHLPDLYLTFACALGDAAALTIFDERYLAPACAALVRSGDSGDFLAELRQRLREKLYAAGGEGGARLRSYNGRAPLTAWLRVVCVRAAQNLRRDRRRDPHGAQLPLPELLLGLGDPEQHVLKAETRAAFKACVEAALATLSERERALLRLHLLSGLSIDGIGQVYGVHRATAARWLARAEERLSREALRLFAERLRLPEEERAAVLAEIRSQLDLSLNRLLRLPDDVAP